MKLAERRSATVYKKERRIIIMSSGRTDQNFSVSALPVIILDDKDVDNPLLVGEAILKALETYQIGIPHPKTQAEWKVFGKDVLQAAGVKSWRVLDKCEHLCIADKVEDGIRITRWIRDKDAAAGHVLSPDDPIIVEYPTPTRVGEIVLEALSDTNEKKQ